MKYIYRYIALIGLVFFSLNLKAQNIPTDTDLLTGKLDNGLTYYIRHNNTPKGQADFYLAQKVGSILEKDSQRGLAHFLEHMAFNGTKHFPGNTMIEKLEKRGVKFGTNINAYTSYDETVYRLTNIPIFNEGLLDTSLLILHDWSGFILNHDKDIDEERGVVREEWRTRSSAYLRAQESQILPTLFAGTRYANRLPIGILEVINNFKYEELRNYYDQWYRPNLQSVIVVGDVDPHRVLIKLKKLFADISNPVNPVPRNYFNIPDHKTPIVAIAADPEIRNASATVYWRQKEDFGVARSSIQHFKMEIINAVISNMINQRFSELAKKNLATHRITCRMGEYSVVSSVPAWTLNIDVPNNDLFFALKTALKECERIHRFGFDINEFEPSIRNFNLITNESNYYDHTNKLSNMYAGEYVEQFLHGGTSPSSEWRYRATKEILNSLSIDTLNFYAQHYMQDYNMAFEILYPKKEILRSPSKTDILDLWKEVKKSRLERWLNKPKQSDIANLNVPSIGKVMGTKERTLPYGYIKWILSNGVEVWFKKTGYHESDLFISGYKPGGYSLVSLEDLPSALAYNQLSRITSGFEGIDGRAAVTSLLNQDSEVIGAKGIIQDAKVLFQSIYLKMNVFKMEEQVFNNWKTRKIEELKSRSVNPKVVYTDTLTAVMSNHHPRALSLTDLKVLNQVKYDKVIRLHKKRFGNANDFTFVITGNLSEDSVRVFTETWLGGLTSFKIKEEVKDHGIYPPKGVIKKHFSKKMETPQSTITIGYSGMIPYTIENNVLMMFCNDILKMIYTETIREKEAGSYGIRLDAEVLKYPEERFIFQVNFDTDPKSGKKDKLISIVYKEIESLKVKGPSQEQVDKIRENLLKDYREDVSKENARYWDGMAGALLVSKIDWRTDYDKIVKSITPDMIKEFAKRLFNQGNIIEVIMNPE